MRHLYITFIAIFAVVVGCSTPKSESPIIGRVNVWGFPSAPAFAATISSSRTLAVYRYEGESRNKHTRELDPDQFEKLRSLLSEAYANALNAIPPPRIVDGTNIRIQFEQNGVLLSSPDLKVTAVKNAGTALATLISEINNLVPTTFAIY
jgi:hypothetical protein